MLKSVNFLQRTVDLAYRIRLGDIEDFVVPMSAPVKKGSLTAIVYAKDLWDKHPLSYRLKSLLKGVFQPSDEILFTEAESVLLESHFGSDSDFGRVLLQLTVAKETLPPMDDKVYSELDADRAHALQVMAYQHTNKLRQIESNFPLGLSLVDYGVEFAFLTVPMTVAVPVHSIRWFIDIDYLRAMFNIRRAIPDRGDQVGDYLYEVCILQVKTSAALDKIREATAETDSDKSDSLFGSSEIDIIVATDSVISYLKATTEKILMLLASAYGIPNLDSETKHKKRVAKLQKHLPNWTRKAYYFDTIWELLSADNLESLNNFRTGLLHKKGVSQLQPHSFVGIRPEDQPSRNLLQFSHEQHRRNSLALLCVLALVVDEIVQKKEPSFSPNFNLYQHLITRVYPNSAPQ